MKIMSERAQHQAGGIYWNGFEPEWDGVTVTWHDGFSWAKFDGETTFVYYHMNQDVDKDMIVDIGRSWILL